MHGEVKTKIMDNKIGNNFRQYRNVIVESSVIGNNVVAGDDSFIRNSTVGNQCRIERRVMVFNSIIGDYTSNGYGSQIRFTQIGKFSSLSWNVSVGGGDSAFQKSHDNTPFPQ